MKKILLSVLFSGCLGLSMAQTIQKAEYFIDTDPGFGNGIALSFTPASSVVIPLNIPISAGLSIGFHKFYIRAKDSNGAWGMVFSQNFFKTSSQEVFDDNVVALEYFIDSDPGFGQAVAVPFSPGSQETVGLVIPIANELPLGFHKFYIRAKDAYGKWSMVYSQNFFKTNELPTIQNITKVEYFFDADPGFGPGTAVAFTPGTTIDLQSQVFNIANTIPNGQHKFYLRAQDANGKWSIVANETITVCEIGATISATPSLNSCGTAITLTANITNPTPNSLTWKWMKDGQFIGFDNQSNISVTASGNYNIQMTNGNSGTCDVVNSGFADVNIKGIDSLNIKSDALASFCGSLVKLNIDEQKSALSADFGFAYQWFQDGNLVASTEQIDISEGGNYQLKMNYLGGYASCTPLQSNIITINNKEPLLSISPVSTFPNTIKVCQGANIRLNAVCDLSENLTYQWFKNSILLVNENGPSLTVSNAPGAYMVKLLNGCPGLSSAIYNLNYETVTQPPFSISLIEGQLSTCPGTLAKIGSSGCTGNIIWSNGQIGNELRATQQNSSQTFSATCQGTCLSASSNVLTLSPSAPTLLPPIIEVERLPVSLAYKFAKSSGFYQQEQFKYADFNPPVGIVPTANGQIFYTDARYDLHLLKNDQSSILLKNESVTGAAAEMTLLLNDLFLTTGSSSAGISGSKSQASFGGDDYWLLARNHFGEKSWDKTYGGSGTEKAIKSIQIPDGNILVVGESSSAANGNKTTPSFGGSDIWIVKTDSDGQKINDFSFGGNATENLADAISLSNSTVLLIGSSNSGISGNKTSAALGGKDIWLICINDSGTILWQKAMGTNQNEEGISAIEKDGLIYLIASDHKIRKLDLDGNLLNEAPFDFDDYFQATSHFTDLHSIHLTPENGILLTARVSGQAEFTGVSNYSYDALYTFEIDPNLNLIPDTKETFGSTNTDQLGKCFFDIQGDFHLVKSNQVFTCPNFSDPIWYAYYLDLSANNSIRCNRPSDNFYGWFQWVISPNIYETRNYIDQCRGTEFLLRAKTANEDFEGQVKFSWSTGDSVAVIKVIPENRIPISLSYKPKNLQNFCGSPVSHIDLFPYENKLLISGTNLEDASRRFAHQEIFSTEKLQVAKNYQAEKGIFLQSGFEITATAQKVFEAKIEGCINE